MEEILSSIKRIIAEDGDQDHAGRALRKKPVIAPPDDDEPLDLADEADDSVLELTDEVAGLDEVSAEPAPTAARAAAKPTRTKASALHLAPAPAVDDGSMLSAASEVAARQALANLSNLLVGPQPGEEATLEGLVRSMLRPMLKDWLDANLPQLVEAMVAKEIARITGRDG